MKATLIILLLVGLSMQCEDLGGGDYCRYVLLKKSNMCDKLTPAELAQCLQTCGVCKDKSASSANNNAAPAWAVAKHTPRQPVRPGRGKPEKVDDEPIALPLYAVILIIVAVLVIFIGITVCVLKLKRKWKKRKVNKNRKLLRHAPPAPDSMHHHYGWGAGSYNNGYHPDMDSWSGNRNVYLPEGSSYHHQPAALNNATAQQDPRHKKNINIVQNGTKDSKRKAPEPPGDTDSTYQNLQQSTSNSKTGNNSKTQKAPNASNDLKKEVVEIPIPYSDSVFSETAPVQNGLQKSEASWNDESPPIPPPRDPVKRENAAAKRNKHQYPEMANNLAAEEESLDGSEVDDNDSDTSTVRVERSLSVVTENTQQTSPALANILNEWKEHLQEQKKELEEYYKSLALYVKRVGLKPAGDVMADRAPPSNDRSMQEWIKSNQVDRNPKYRHKAEPLVYSERPYTSIHEQNYSAMMKFPTPPESVRGDFTWQPDDEQSQKQVIVDLKKKLARLQNLLESTQEMAESDKKSSAYYIPSQHSKSTRNQAKNEYLGDRITIKVLLQKLEERERLKVQMRIAQALDTSRKRGGMNIASRDGPITCLAKQIHHVMSDILDPRTSTKIELGAHAACTLATKLLTNVHANLLPVLNSETSRQNVARTTDRISILSKQLLDMTKQLIARHSSFQPKDYSVFVNAFVDTTEKIMDTTFHLVCVIVDLQTAERRGLIKSQSHTTHSHVTHQKQQPRGIPHRQSVPAQGKQVKDEILHRLHSESNSTSLSAVDVRRLNEDLSKLRQLLNTETNIPSLSGLTTPRKINFDQNHLDNAGYDYDGQNMSECDTMSTFSCSTCITANDDQYFYSDDIPPPPPPKFSSPPSDPKRKTDGRVQYTDIMFDSENQRPSTRPVIKEGIQNDYNLPPSAVFLDRPKPQPLLPVSAQASHIESMKGSQRKASTLDPSSFASFHSERDVLVNDDVQPRHQAMLARYFGGETMESEKSLIDRPKDHLKESLENPTTPAINQAILPLIEVEENTGDCPTVTMLPCGLVAQDTPPITNPPKEKRVKLPKIPEITVVRNSEAEENQSIPGIAQANAPNAEIPISPLYADDDPYSYTDTLPIHRKQDDVKSHTTDFDNDAHSNSSEENSLKKNHSVNYLDDDDYELHMPTSPKYVEDFTNENDMPKTDNADPQIHSHDLEEKRSGDSKIDGFRNELPNDLPNELPDGFEKRLDDFPKELPDDVRNENFDDFPSKIPDEFTEECPIDLGDERPDKSESERPDSFVDECPDESENERSDFEKKPEKKDIDNKSVDSEEDSIASFSMSVADALTDDESVITAKMKSESYEDDPIPNDVTIPDRRPDEANDGLISEFEFPRVKSGMKNDNSSRGSLDSRKNTPEPDVVLDTQSQSSHLNNDIAKFTEDTDSDRQSDKPTDVIYDVVCDSNDFETPNIYDTPPDDFQMENPSVFNKSMEFQDNRSIKSQLSNISDKDGKSANRKNKKFGLKMPKLFGKKK